MSSPDVADTNENVDGRQEDADGEGETVSLLQETAAEEEAPAADVKVDVEPEKGDKPKPKVTNSLKKRKPSTKETATAASYVSAVDDVRAFHASIIVIIAYLMLGALTMSKLEGWTYLEGVYFSVTTVTTVGYGDFLPTKASTKLFTAFYIWGAITIFSFALGIVFSDTDNDSAGIEEAKQIEKAVDNSGIFSGYKEVFKAFAVLLSIMAVGVLFAIVHMEMTAVDAIYFASVTMSTVGYGDMSFSTETGFYFGIVYLVVATVATASAVSSMIDNRVQAKEEDRQRHWIKNYVKANTEAIANMDQDNDGQVYLYEFVKFMLTQTKKASRDDFRHMEMVFMRLNLEHENEHLFHQTLDQQDLEKFRQLSEEDETKLLDFSRPHENDQKEFWTETVWKRNKEGKWVVDKKAQQLTGKSAKEDMSLAQ
jgi:potassium channel subfamily K